MKWSSKPYYNVIGDGIKDSWTVRKPVLGPRYWNLRVRMSKIGSHRYIQVRTD